MALHTPLIPSNFLAVQHLPLMYARWRETITYLTHFVFVKHSQSIQTTEKNTQVGGFTKLTNGARGQGQCKQSWI